MFKIKEETCILITLWNSGRKEALKKVEKLIKDGWTIKDVDDKDLLNIPTIIMTKRI